MNKFYLKLLLFLTAFSSTAFAQQGIIRGTVYDEGSGETLIGVTVLAKGTNYGAITDFDGKFEIALDHFENVKTVIKSNELPKIYDIFKKWNNERLSYPVYEEVLLKYGFE